MSTPSPATVSHFDNTAPAAPAGKKNVTWQEGSPYPETIVYQGVTYAVTASDISAYVDAPGTGGTTVAVAKIPLAPASAGNFIVAHGLGFAPSFVIVEMESGGNIWLQTPAFDATNIYLVASDSGVIGIAACFLSAADAQISLAPSSPGAYVIAHGLAATPALVLIQMTSGGSIWFQSPTGWDATNLYLEASDSGITGLAECWEKVPIVAVTGYVKIALAPPSAGNFTVLHGLGQVPTLVLIRMTSSGAIWLQSDPFDITNIYLVASDSGVTADAEIWVG